MFIEQGRPTTIARAMAALQRRVDAGKLDRAAVAAMVHNHVGDARGHQGPTRYAAFQVMRLMPIEPSDPVCGVSGVNGSNGSPDARRRYTATEAPGAPPSDVGW